MGASRVGRLIGYARVSTEEQNLEMQIAALEKAGVPRSSIHVEKVSAAVSQRPKLSWAIESLREGDTLVCWKMDRIARSLADLMRRIKQIEDSGANFRSLTEHIDTTTPGGRLIFHVLGALAEFERDLIRERTRAGVKAAQERGVRFGVDPKLSPKQIAEAQRMRDRGQSVYKIAEHFDVAHTTIYNWTSGPKRPRKR